MKDLRLLKKATALFPRLNEKEIAVAETVSITRDGKGIKKKSLRDFRTMSLKKGDEVILDFGGHLVGYLSLDFKNIGAHADAPVLLKVRFAEREVELFEDGPKRDRRLWIGDLRIQALANYETYRMNDMVKSCLYLFGALTQENGRVGACVFLEPEPEVDDTCMFDYSLFFVVILRDYYRKTGDQEALEDLWQVCRRQISLAREGLDQHYVVKDLDVLGWCFVDWNLELNKQASAQGIFLYALEAAIELAEQVGDVLSEEEYADLYNKVKDAANTFLYDEKMGMYVSGKDRQISFASQIWMILGNAVEGSAALRLLERLNGCDGAVKMVTPYMYHNYIDALIKLGRKEDAHNLMRQYWGGMIKNGADTFWELYNPENPDESPYGGTIVNSYCHAWSCGPAYFLRKYFA